MGALYGGTALFLVGRLLFLRLSVGTVSYPQVVAVGCLLVLLPVGHLLPAAVALGLLAGLLAAAAVVQRFAVAGPAALG